jgi:hypothetical protein
MLSLLLIDEWTKSLYMCDLFCSLQQRMTLLFNSNFHHVLFLQDLSVLDDLSFLMSFAITIKNKPIFSVILCSAVICFQQARKS